jgi:hypothetical protein
MIRGFAKKTKHFSFEFSFQFFSKDKRASAPKKTELQGHSIGALDSAVSLKKGNEKK